MTHLHLCQMRKSSSFKSDQIVLKKAFFPYDLNRENLFVFKSKHLGTYENLEINGLFIAKNNHVSLMPLMISSQPVIYNIST